MNMWILVVVMWFHEGYAGGMTSQTMYFNDLKSCDTTGKTMVKDYEYFRPENNWRNSGKSYYKCYKVDSNSLIK